MPQSKCVLFMTAVAIRVIIKCFCVMLKYGISHHK